MEKIIVYTQGACGYCKTVKDELQKERLIDEWKKEWNDLAILTGIAMTPTVCYEDSYFIPARDFGNPQQLVEILKNYKKPMLSESKQALERIKTLNSNINTAFGRLDQLLRTIETKLNTEKDEHKSTS